MSFQDHLLPFAELPLNRQVIHSALKAYRRPYDKISELLRQGILIAVKNGLYVPGPKADIQGPEPFTLSNHLYGPSYVSLESALSWWGLIPEQVYGVTAVCLGTSKRMNTALGRFSYQHLPLPYYSFGINRLALSRKQQVLIASPEKALCDTVICSSGVQFRSKAEAYLFLTEDLRIAEGSLKQLNTEGIRSWIPDSPKKKTLEILSNTIDNL